MATHSPSRPRDRNRPSLLSEAPARPQRRIQTRRSSVHGNGVFAVQPIAEGETVLEYRGEIISWEEALRRHPHDPAQPNHTFYFHIDEERVIDGKIHGNSAKWINHCCDPNCIADEQDGRIFIKALRDIASGEELNYDYGLVIDEEYTPELLAEFPCWCSAESCRGTLLAPKDEEDEAKAGKKKKDKKDKKDKKEKKEKKEKKKDKQKKKKAEKDKAKG